MESALVLVEGAPPIPEYWLRRPTLMATKQKTWMFLDLVVKLMVYVS